MFIAADYLNKISFILVNLIIAQFHICEKWTQPVCK